MLRCNCERASVKVGHGSFSAQEQGDTALSGSRQHQLARDCVPGYEVTCTQAPLSQEETLAVVEQSAHMHVSLRCGVGDQPSLSHVRGFRTGSATRRLQCALQFPARSCGS